MVYWILLVPLTTTAHWTNTKETPDPSTQFQLSGRNCRVQANLEQAIEAKQPLGLGPA